jgi:hypothetical protein
MQLYRFLALSGMQPRLRYFVLEPCSTRLAFRLLLPVPLPVLEPARASIRRRGEPGQALARNPQLYAQRAYRLVEPATAEFVQQAVAPALWEEELRRPGDTRLAVAVAVACCSGEMNQPIGGYRSR